MIRLIQSFLIAAGLVTTAVARETPRPNIVIILADDMGWGDPQCYQNDSKIPTPNLDRLAKEGMRFTDAHTPSSVCTPTRYSLLTGRYCWRTSLEKGVLDGFGPPLIGQNEVTIASMLKKLGYSTACVGKWHLGMQWHDKNGEPLGERGPQRFRSGSDVDFERDITGGPLDVGFDRYFGISASLDMSPYCYIKNRRTENLPTDFHDEIKGTLFFNGVSGVKSPDFNIHDVLPRFGREAVDVINQFRGQDDPFFLYLPLNSPHLPVSPSSSVKGKSQAGDYGDFVWETDQIVGRVLDALDDNGISENTLVLFTSDNGGLWHWWDFRADDDGGKAPVTGRGQYVKDFGHQSNADWRGTKADIYEGGHRVPFLVRWPSVVGKSKTSDALVELTDVFATISEITNEKTLKGTSGMDSVSFLPILKGISNQTRTVSIHHSLRGTFAVRKADWKMVEGRGSGGFTRPRGSEEIPGKPKLPLGQLYNLATDPQETNNLWDSETKRTEGLQRILNLVKNSSARNAQGVAQHPGGPPTSFPEATEEQLDAHESVVYARYGDRELELDLYRPKEAGDQPIPGIVCIHGGGWWRGERTNHTILAKSLASRGYAAATITYRLSGEAKFPAQIHDCKAAVRFLRANASKYGIDPDKIGAIGLSAGGHLTALLATSGGVEELEGSGGHPGQSSAIQAAVPLGAQTDFRRHHDNIEKSDPNPTGEKPNIWLQFMGCRPSEDIAKWKQASPITHLNAGDPPIHFVSGENDNETTHAEKFRGEMVDLDIPNDLTIIPGAPHAFPGRQIWFDIMLDAAVGWFDKQLK